MKKMQTAVHAARFAAPLMVIALLVNQAAAELIGNPLIASTDGNPTDGQSTIFEVHYNAPIPATALPSRLTSVSVYQQAAGTFEVEVLHPLGGGEYKVTYESAPITTTATNSVAMYSLPGDPSVAAGDLFATYGTGIPFNANQTQSPADITYYPISTIPAVGSTIDLSNNYPTDPNAFQFYTGDAVRIYSVAVDLEPVPEPSSIVALVGLCGMGLVGLLRYRHRKVA
jgi:hypothetical protein